MITYTIQYISWKEDDPIYGSAWIIQDISTGVTTDGKTQKEAISNLKEAVSLYYDTSEETPEDFKFSNPQFGKLTVHA